MSIQDAPPDPGRAAPIPGANAPSNATPSGPDPAAAGGLLTIDLTAIETNWRTLSSRTVPIECAAVVKADAYGCGLEPVTTRLAKAGCKTFFVADLAEGRQVRALARGAVIYVLNGLLPHTAQAFADANLRPVINGPAELAEWDAYVSGTNWRGGAALHVDTGMNRLGLSPDEAVAVASRAQLENHGFTLLMSHLACAEAPSHPMNDRQIRMFRELRILFRGVSSSLANSSGICRSFIGWLGASAQARWLISSLRSAAGDRNKPPAQVIVAGKRCPIAGRVSMDLITVDVTDVADGRARRGDFVTLIGSDLGIDEVATSLGTIGYEVLTRLGRRLHRVYKGG